jgi:predicted CXXCH cytochrome family protein
MQSYPDMQASLRVRRLLRPLRALLCLALLGLLAGCEPGSRQQRLMRGLINGLPELPTPEAYCSEYQRTRDAASAGNAPVKKAAVQIVHPPYGEKRCSDCHTQEKDVQAGLVAPRNELCFICHPDILKGEWTHGPVQSGDCLACHVPHSSAFASLLDTEPTKICERCHAEKRRAPAMHDMVSKKLINCTDCHDPHSGSNHYFLK